MVEFDTNPPDSIANPDLFGHSEAEGEFLKSYDKGRLPHAWLISGPAGIGKATLAYRIARFILTRGSSTHETAGLFSEDISKNKPNNLSVDISNPICRRIISGGHPDFLCIKRGIDEKIGKERKEITVGETRNIASFLAKTPSEGGWRVITVDSADDLNTNAANAVLKVLEEPSKRSLLILVSNNPAKLLPTIRSRCRRLVLKPLSKKTIHRFFMKYNPKIPSKDLDQLLEIADGSIGKALGIINDGGLDTYRELNEILTKLPHVDIPRLHFFGDKLNRDKSGKIIEHTFNIINRWLIHAIKQNAINKISSLDPWFQVWENTERLFNKTRRLNLDPKLTILNTFNEIKKATTQKGS